ncbi:MAG: radical SAM/SPASM domain-containing protein [Vagococcus fluvialis]|uniref:radical SAM/SPASM domain-containing protein n=1 Tax=Vagococcus fluvialis TaxID=2738 RepID=UPI000A33F07A|nr:SPASM domain-containing protein [Vagococcus fluvialis]MBO0420456.1 SPASM domain-containing protein [Vagococcus fluvialis]OTP31679.1 anaerobic sulfatase maturase [Enterococcus sp. 6C8_DIV0013]
MKHISVLIKPASSLCNIKCRYCFYNDISSIREVNSYGKMTKELASTMIDQIYVDLEDGDTLSLAFQGGEPTLAGLPFYRYLIDYINGQSKKVQVNYAIQTNGMVINDKWCQLLKENHFLVGLSMDGPAIFHDEGRVDWRQRGTFQRVRKTKELFDKHDIEYNILTVLTNQVAREPDKLMDFILEENIKFIQFIPCLEALSDEYQHDYALSPEEFAFFYKRIYARWLAEMKVGNYISIKLFDDLFHLLLNRQVTACGINGKCQTQYVIEGDGSVYPCDFYVMDEYRLGNIQDQTLKELFSQDINISFMCEKRKNTKQCLNCPYQNLCGGGCKRMSDTIYVNKEDTYCGFKEVLDTYTKELPQLVGYVRSMGR